MHIPINLVFEDTISEEVMIILLQAFGKKFAVGNSYHGHGFGYIKSNIHGFNQAAIATPFFILTDLDNYPCPPALIDDWLRKPMHSNFIFRIAVREVETWLLADRDGFAEFTGISKANIPTNPEELKDPKATLIGLAKKSKKRKIREDLVPINVNAKIGPNYNDRLHEYLTNFWNLNRAMKVSSSLHRAFKNLDSFKYSV